MAGLTRAGDVTVIHNGVAPGGYHVTGFAVVIGSDMVGVFAGGAHAIIRYMAALATS